MQCAHAACLVQRWLCKRSPEGSAAPCLPPPLRLLSSSAHSLCSPVPVPSCPALPPNNVNVCVCVRVRVRDMGLGPNSKPTHALPSNKQVTELAGGARIRHIFQEIFTHGLEALDPCA